MTWVNDKAVIEAALSGYTEWEIDDKSKDLEDVPSSRIHKTFIVRAVGVDEQELVNRSSINSTLVRLEILYKEGGSDNYDKNYDLFKSVRTSIRALTNHVSDETFEFERVRDKVNKGIYEFYYGYYNC